MTMIIDGTNGGFFPSWTTATRPASPAVGQVGYNTTTGQFDAYTSNGWTSVATSATAATSGPAFSVYRNGDQNISSQVNTKVAFNAEVFDTNNCFDSTTNYRFTPNVAGYYQINFSLQPNGSNAYVISTISKNGSLTGAGSGFRGNRIDANGNVTSVCSALVYLNGSTDYIECYGYVSYTQFAGTPASADYCWAMGFLARTA